MIFEGPFPPKWLSQIYDATARANREPECERRHQKQPEVWKHRREPPPLVDFPPTGRFKGWQRQKALQNSSHPKFNNSHLCFDIYTELTT